MLTFVHHRLFAPIHPSRSSATCSMLLLARSPAQTRPPPPTLQCIMITGDNPLTAVHVAKDVEIIDREALILDLRETPTSPSSLSWRTVDESKIIPFDPTSEPLDTSLLANYDICITGPALKQFEALPEAWAVLVQHTWVYARVSPSQKEFILTSLRSLGYTTLMAGDGTNDVGALKQAHIGVALLDGTMDDLKKIAERERLERLKKVYVSQLGISERFGQPPPPVPEAIRHLVPEAVEAQRRAAEEQKVGKRANPMEKVCFLTVLPLFPLCF